MNSNLLSARSDLGPDELKACCSAIYDSELVQLLLGESFHPGGLALTDRLAGLTRIDSTTQILDIASGRGTSAIHLSQTYGCDVTAVDLSPNNCDFGRKAANDNGLTDRVSFEVGDAEELPFGNALYDVVICECALCTFPNKSAACSEVCRVLKPGGRFGISDVLREATLPATLDNVMAMVACIADARSLEEYASLLADAGLVVNATERHSNSIHEMLDQVESKLVGAQLLASTGHIQLDGFDLTQARSIVRDAKVAVANGLLGYGLLVGTKPSESV